jgi:type I restriction enzyme M protein
MYTVISEHVFPWLRTVGGDGTTYSKHTEGATASPYLEDRDSKGDLYEYMLGKIATAGQNGQFRTPAGSWSRWEEECCLTIVLDQIASFPPR